MRCTASLGKKGVFFTFVAIFIVILVVASVSTRKTYRYSERSDAISTRIRTMNSFIDDYKKDLDREVYIGGYRAILSMNTYIKQIDDYVKDFDAVFTEVLVNGTADGEVMNLMKQETEEDTYGASIQSWLWRVNEKAAQMNMAVDIAVNDVSVTQESPWSVIVFVNVTTTVSDLRGLASWTFTDVHSSEIPIKGFEDPLYIIGTDDGLSNLINITPDTDFVDESTKTVDVLYNHLINSYYFANTKAPSYLMRFEGNFSGSPYGIESMVNVMKIRNIAKFADINPYLFSYSVVDYVYFGEGMIDGVDAVEYCNFTGQLPDWFRIDQGHINDYGLQVFSNESFQCPVT